VKRYTPRQAFALLMINRDLEHNERAVALHDAAMAAQGSGKDIDKLLKSLTGDKT
jgi:hypothetical protein